MIIKYLGRKTKGHLDETSVALKVLAMCNRTRQKTCKGNNEKNIILGNRCSIRMSPRIPVNLRRVHNQNTRLCMPLGCTVHHLVCTAQPPRAYINSTSCLVLHQIGVEYLARENVTPEITRVSKRKREGSFTPTFP